MKLGRLILLSINFIQLWQSCIKIFYQFSEVEVSLNLQKNYCGLFWNILPNFSNINQLDWRYFTNIRSESELTLPHLLYWLYLYWIICNIYKEIININLIFSITKLQNNSTHQDYLFLWGLVYFWMATRRCCSPGWGTACWAGHYTPGSGPRRWSGRSWGSRSAAGQHL